MGEPLCLVHVLGFGPDNTPRHGSPRSHRRLRRSVQPSILFLSSLPSDLQLLLVDPATSIVFPTTLRITSKVPLPLFSLVGVGVRTVSFLGIKVYSVGFYADLNNPNLKIPKEATPDEKIRHIIRTTACLIRIGAFPLTHF
jgi:hypothetical protein